MQSDSSLERKVKASGLVFVSLMMFLHSVKVVEITQCSAQMVMTIL